MILESIVTTIGDNGNVNIAPMGPSVQGNGVEEPIAEITLRPFKSSTTYANLKASNHTYRGKAVVHVTDDSMLFARGAAGDITPDQAVKMVTPLDHQGYVRLINCYRWFAVQAEQFSEDDLRATITCRIIESGTAQPYFGFNRARYAVVEAAILATRTHLIAAETISEELTRLEPLVDKTGGLSERKAFDFLVQVIEQRTQTEYPDLKRLTENG